MSLDITYCCNSACCLREICQRANPPNKGKHDWHSEIVGRGLSWAKFEPVVCGGGTTKCDYYMKRNTAS